MSVWTNVEGTINLPLDTHISVSKLIKQYFDEVVIIRIEQIKNGKVTVFVSFDFSNDGMSAATQLSDFAKYLSDKNCTGCLHATLEFLV